MGQKFCQDCSISHGLEVIKGFVFSSLIKILMLTLMLYQNLIICRSLYHASIYQISGEYFKRFLSYHLDKQNPVFGHVTSLIG